MSSSPHQLWVLPRFFNRLPWDGNDYKLPLRSTEISIRLAWFMNSVLLASFSQLAVPVRGQRRPFILYRTERRLFSKQLNRLLKYVPLIITLCWWNTRWSGLISQICRACVYNIIVMLNYSCIAVLRLIRLITHAGHAAGVKPKRTDFAERDES